MSFSSSASSASSNGDDIDEGLYSRQLYVLGHEAMRKMQASNVLVSGMSGLGLEIAKNVVLGGVKSMTIHDSQPLTYDDLATHYFASEIGKNRAACAQPHLAELNIYVPVRILEAASTRPLKCSDLAGFQVVVLTQSTTAEQLELGTYCHQNGIKLIVAETRGIFGQIFCDFGEKFEIIDTNGERPLSAMVMEINNDEQGIVTTLPDQRHGFDDDMVVTFTDVRGMECLNGREFTIKVFGPYSFGIGDTTAFPKHVGGGYAHEVCVFI